MNVGVPRRAFSLLFVVCLASLVILLFTHSDWSTMPRARDWANPFTTDSGILNFGGRFSGKDPIRIAFVESVGTHDEVWAAMLDAFGGNPDAEISLYLKTKRYGVAEIMKNLKLNAPITKDARLDKLNPEIGSKAAAPAPDVLVSITCELDLEDKRVVDTLEHLLQNEKTWLMCLFHHADRWVKGQHVDIIRRWVDAERAEFVGLSQHTVDYLTQHTIPKWNTDKPILARAIPPVLPVSLPEFDAATAPGLSLAMQGDYEPNRRNYAGIFSQLDTIVDKAPEANMSVDKVMLHLIGHGNRPSVPDDVKHHVQFDASLSYPDFYALLDKMFALLPAFASDTYYSHKASSSVPASLIAGTPIVANKQLLDAYSYLPREATWEQHDGEEELDVIARVMGNKEEYLYRRELVQKACKDIAKQNRINTIEWVNEAVQKMKSRPKSEIETETGTVSS